MQTERYSPSRRGNLGAEVIRAAPGKSLQHQRTGSRGNYFATGIVNSAPLPMLSGQRCITDL
jgi:hypothetical protein